MKLGVRGKLFVVSVVLIAVVGLASGVFLEHNLRGWFVGRIEQGLLHDARSTHALLEVAGPDPTVEKIDQLADRMGEATGARITIIARDGAVLGDSQLTVDEVYAVENHAGRPEITAALGGQQGSSQRFSTTLDQEMYYVAIPLEAAAVSGVVRASMPLEEVNANIWRLRVLMIIAALVGLAVAIFMSGLASHLIARTLRRLVDRVRQMSRSASEPENLKRPHIHGTNPALSSSLLGGADELGGLAGSINQLSAELSETVDLLARERDRFEAVLESMSEAVVALDDQQRISLVNPSAMELLEVNEAPTGRHLLEVIRVPALQELIDNCRAGEPSSAEFELIGASNRSVLARAAPQSTTDGSVVVMHDVTELRRLETMRRDFVANVSHELRTPVSVIRATVETLQDGALDDPKHAPRFLEALERNANRLASLIEDLLDISKIEAGRMTLEPESVELYEAVERTLDTVARRAAAKHLALENSVPDDLSAVADPTILDQVLLNLVDNAVKYTPEEGRVEVRATKRPEDVLIEVIDNGPGIAAKHHDRIFERFYRVDTGRSRKVGGTGLGLSIVKHLVNSMGGEVGYRLNEPNGSVFWLTLKIAK